MKQLATDSVQRPSLALLGAEPFRAAMELACHKFAKSATTEPGDGHAVVIFPGLGASGGSVATLREHCRSLGYDASTAATSAWAGTGMCLQRSETASVSHPVHGADT